MQLNEFSLRILGGKEVSGGYVEMEHDQKYSIVVRNQHNRRCDCEIFVDGKSIGAWRLDPYSNATLERPVGDTGKFTFFREESKEAEAAQVDRISKDNRGLVQAIFKLEKFIPPVPRPVKAVDDSFDFTSTKSASKGSSAGGARIGSRALFSRSVFERDLSGYVPGADLDEFSSSVDSSSHTAGVTGLTGESNQRFDTTSKLQEYDEDFTTTITLRLVEKKSVRPLQSQFSSPIPSLPR